MNAGLMLLLFLERKCLLVCFVFMLLLVPIAHASSAEDADGDGVLDGADRCPEGESAWTSNGTSDVDGDGCKDATEDWDDDGDGFEDHANATRPDGCPVVYGTSSLGDVFGCPDADLDGWADSLDAFPHEMTQWSDADGDGYGDRTTGHEGDACPSAPGTSFIDRWGCLDSDQDGYSDAGDAFPENPTQHSDRDGDGYGDNASLDATMIDAFPLNPLQWSDEDGDGYGDNVVCVHYDAHPKDDEEWAADDECDIEDDDGFEVMIPGTMITISAWDLIGVLTGGPLAVWLLFAVSTRDKRCGEFEARLRSAGSREEIEEVATEYERALMLRMIGVHHGLRLERLRAESDDVFEMSASRRDEEA